MADVLSKGALFPEQLMTEVVNKVKGHSSLIKLSQQMPIAFNGNEVFTFSLDNEIDVVAENGKKTHGGATVGSVKVQPIKVEYGARVSDEFLYASDEAKVNILRPFMDGYAKKLARGLDLMALHGVNPRTGEKSSVIGENYLDGKATQTLPYDAAKPDENIEAAVALVQGAGNEISGMALAPAFSASLAKLKVNGVQQFPEFRWGARPESVNGLMVDVNETVSASKSKDRAIIGDFANNFKWGFAKQVPMEVIKYGDPDNSGKDLRGYNQVYIRCETYLGWAIMDGNAFAKVEESAGSESH